MADTAAAGRGISHSISSPYTSPSSIKLGVNILNHAPGHAANHPASAVPAERHPPAIVITSAPPDGDAKLSNAPLSPPIIPPPAMIGTTIALATTPTADNWLKWYAVSAAVPSNAQNETAT